MTLVRLDDVEEIIRAHATIDFPWEKLIEACRSLAATGSNDGLDRFFVAPKNLPPEIADCIAEQHARLAATGETQHPGALADLVERGDLQAAAELQSARTNKRAYLDKVHVEARAELAALREKARILEDIMQVLPFTEWGRSDAGNVYRSRYRSLTPPAAQKEMESDV